MKNLITITTIFIILANCSINCSANDEKVRNQFRFYDIEIERAGNYEFNHKRLIKYGKQISNQNRFFLDESPQWYRYGTCIKTDYLNEINSITMEKMKKNVSHSFFGRLCNKETVNPHSFDAIVSRGIIYKKQGTSEFERHNFLVCGYIEWMKKYTNLECPNNSLSSSEIWNIISN
jgi:hypothetical protein